MSSEILKENMQSAGDDKEKIKSPAPLIAPQGDKREDEERVVERINQLNIAPNNKKCDKDAPNTGVAVQNAESDALKLLLSYDSDSSYSSEAEIMNFHMENTRRVLETSSSSSSSSSSSDEDEPEIIDDDDDDDNESVIETSAPSMNLQSKGAIKKDPPPKSNGELGMDDLPPVPDLSTLSLTAEEDLIFVHMGNVMGIVDRLVTIAALPNTPAYDLDTLLFLEDGKKPLGFVFDVLGQVTSPIYAVRFNSVQDIKNLGVAPGIKVYAAPQGKHTKYVFLQQLLKMKGSDASWLGDNEVPAEFADFSDDENEFVKPRVPHHQQQQQQKRPHGNDYKKFESTMNKRNLLDTKLNKYMDTFRENCYKLKGRKPGGGGRSGGVAANSSTSTSVPTPVFDPLVPPPNLATPSRHNYPAVPPSGGFYYYPGSVSNSVPYLPPDFMGMYNNVLPTTPGPGDNNNSRSNPATFSGFQNGLPEGFLGNLTGYYNNQQFGEHPAGGPPGPSSHQS